MSTNFSDINISAVATTSSTRTRSRNVHRAGFPASWERWFYRNSKGWREGMAQMMARIVVGSIAPCLHFSALFPINRNLSSQFVMRIINDCHTNLIFKLLDRGRNLAPIYRSKVVNRSVQRCLFCYRVPPICDLSSEQLQFVPKAVFATSVRWLRSLPVEQASGTHKIGFGSSDLSPLLRTLQSIVAANIHRSRTVD